MWVEPFEPLAKSPSHGCFCRWPNEVGCHLGMLQGYPTWLVKAACTKNQGPQSVHVLAAIWIFFLKKKTDHSSSLAKATHIHSPDSLSVVAVVPECQHDRQVLPCSTPPKEAFVPRSFFRFVPHCWVGGARIYLPGLWRGTLHHWIELLWFKETIFRSTFSTIQISICLSFPYFLLKQRFVSK